MARGDVLLYHDNDLVSRLIQWRTHGPFNHVAVDIGGGRCIGAFPKGVGEENIRDDVVFVPIPESADVESALTWLSEQLKMRYAWSDILADVFPTKWPFRLIFRQEDAYDCSDLVARYLDLAKVLPLAELGGDAQTVTPNDLARAFREKGWIYW